MYNNPEKLSLLHICYFGNQLTMVAIPVDRDKKFKHRSYLKKNLPSAVGDFPVLAMDWLFLLANGLT